MIDAWAVAAISISIMALIYPFLRKLGASLSITIGLVLIYMLEIISYATAGRPRTLDDFPYNLAFSPLYLNSGDSLYTIFTSMFIHSPELTHGGLWHILFNAITLVFIGMLLEERIRTSKFIVIFIVSGLVGNLTYGIANLGTFSVALGASGAISGILGAIGILYPRERMNFIIYFLPLRNIPMWVIVLIFLAIQLLLSLSPNSGIAWQAHVGGFATGLVLAPYLMRESKYSKLERSESIDIEKLASTKEQKEIAAKIKSETIPEVRNAWLEEFAKIAVCPICQSQLKIYRSGFKCRNNHRFRIGKGIS